MSSENEKLVVRSMEDIAQTVCEVSDKIRAGRFSGPDDTRYLLERLYDDVSEFMDLVCTWTRVREELENRR